MVKIPSFHCRDVDFIPGLGTKVPHAMWHGHKKGNQQCRYNYIEVKLVIVKMLGVRREELCFVLVSDDQG